VRWQQTLVHLLWDVSTRTLTLLDIALADTPLTGAGFGLLQRINSRPGITIAEMSRLAPTTQQALSQIAARLEKLGFIERKLARGERGIALHMTDAGSAALDAAFEAALAFEASLAAALGARRYGRLVDLLQDAAPIMRELKPGRRRDP
jgi:DNA-binding MarR family transcriptional regulator